MKTSEFIIIMFRGTLRNIGLKDRTNGKVKVGDIYKAARKYDVPR